MQVFIVALTNHFNFGLLPIPYFAEKSEDDTLEIQEQVSASRKRQDLTEVEKKILKASSAYSDKNLKNIYSKEKTVSAFLKKVTQDTFANHIRPFIDQKSLEILHLIREHNIPLYNRASGTKQLFSHHRIQVTENLVQPVFHFELDEDAFKYSIRCYLDDHEIDLQEERPASVLVQSPACIIGNQLLLQFDNMPANKIMPFFNRREVEAPISMVDKYMEQIVLPAVTHHKVQAIGFHINEEVTERKAKIGFEISIFDKPIIQLSFHYGDKTFSSSKHVSKKHTKLIHDESGYSIKYFERDKAWEKEKEQLLRTLGLNEVGEWTFTVVDENLSVYEWIKLHQDVLNKEFEYALEDKNSNLYLGEISLVKNLTEKSDWFDLDIKVILDKYTLPFSSFSWHILNGIREYKLPDNRIVILPEEWFSKYSDLFLFGNATEESIRLKRTQMGIIKQVVSEEATDQYIKKTTYPIPAELKATLRDYQKIGYQWLRHLRENNFGGCLADDMGLGKTIQTIALLQSIYPKENQQNATKEKAQTQYTPDKQGQYSLFDDNGNGFVAQDAIPNSQQKDSHSASLIIAPTSVLKNWSREIKKFSRLSVFEYTGTDRMRNKQIGKLFDHFDVILTTYGLLRADIEILKEYPFELVVLDESQYIKNPDSITYKSALQLSTKQRITLTGTPIENSLKDSWAQFNFINRGMLGSLAAFKDNYLIPIEKGGNEHISSRFQALINPFMLRRTKEQVAPELPDLTEEILFCEMTEEQREVYQKEKNSLRNKLLKMQEEGVLHKNRFTALQGILRLRQVANHPSMIDPNYTFSSGKIETILDAFKELKEGGHKVLIFSAFTKHLALLEKAFMEEGWPYALLTGSTKNRQEVIDRFSQSADIQAFFISLKAGGVGLNLSEADYVFIIDPWWNPAAEAQAIDRAHRIGQEKHVFVYRFITLHSIEEKILALQEKKSKLFESFIQTNNPLQTLSDQDWEDMLGMADKSNA